MTDKNITRYKTQQAVKNGLLTPVPCSICGAMEVEAHHPDYTDHMAVIWLCRADHVLVTSRRMCPIAEKPWRDESGCTRVHTYLLTDNQTEVLWELLKGQTNLQIGHALNMSLARVKNYIRIIYRNLRIRNERQMVPLVRTIKQEMGWL